MKQIINYREKESKQPIIEAPYCDMCVCRTEMCIKFNSDNVKKFREFAEKIFYDIFFSCLNEENKTIEIEIPFVAVQPVGKNKECHIIYECDRKVKVLNILFKTEEKYCSYFQYHIFVEELINLFEKNNYKLNSKGHKERLFYSPKRFVFKRELK